MSLEWKQKQGRTFRYWIADTPDGRVRVSRVSKTGVPAFRVYYPDGQTFTAETPEYAKEIAEIHMQQTSRNLAPSVLYGATR